MLIHPTQSTCRQNLIANLHVLTAYNQFGSLGHFVLNSKWNYKTELEIVAQESKE